MSGNHRITFIAVFLIVFLLEACALACPACSVSDPDAKAKAGQSFWILSAMGIIPLCVAAFVAFYIVRLSKSE